MTNKQVISGGSSYASFLQAEASRPQQSVIVSANAGTGKTKVLTQRVLRLLLSGAEPDTILCVTFTKAAAAEMRHRLNESLANWAIWDVSKLLGHFKEIGLGRPTQKQIKIARNLFAHILDHEDGPKIETVHSFCQSLLSRFPVEAGVPPQFQLAAETETINLCRDSFYSVIKRPNPVLSDDIAFLSAWIDDTSLNDFVRQIVGKRALVSHYVTDPQALMRFDQHMASTFQLFDPKEIEQLKAETYAGLGPHKLEDISKMLSKGGASLTKRADKIMSWCTLPDSRKPDQLQLLIDAFFKNDGERYVTYSSAALDKLYPDCKARQHAILDIIEDYARKKSGALCRRLSLALARVSAETYRQFQIEKASRGLLDYDDLIWFAEGLLGQEQMMAWVRWKLDNGINHLLVDEAQDTSPAQWSLLHKLSAPFFESSDENLSRTFFAVGDFKQSIYSFQGAEPEVFAQTAISICNAAEANKKPIARIPFVRSFRSSAAVLQFVDNIMENDAILGVGDHYQRHEIEKENMPGLVEIWPVTTGEAGDKAPPFFPPPLANWQSAEAQHAQRVTHHILKIVSGGEPHLGSVSPGHILILVHKRDSFSALLRAALQSAGLPVAGADRLTLTSQIEIQDMLALGDVCLLPEDDLQLAALLKSPLIGCDEEQLLFLASTRGDSTLFDALMRHDGDDTIFSDACAKLMRWRAMADQLPVFEFYSAVLTNGGRDAFHHRFGAVIDDSLNAFLLNAREHGKAGASGLSHFLDEFRQGGGDMKRDMDAKAGTEIRIMTIHGAKGLEAPVVYLPDMLVSRKPVDRLVMTEKGAFLSPGTSFTPDFIIQAKQAFQAQQHEEEDRLLYVALTRARNALFMSGWSQSRRRRSEGSWYQLARNTLAVMLHADPAEEIVLRHQSGQRDGADTETIYKFPDISDEIPVWYHSLPPAEQVPSGPLTPSDAGDGDIAMPFGAEVRNQARRAGTFAHQLLNILPHLSVGARNQSIRRVSASYQSGRQPLSREACDKIITDVTALIDSPRWHALFTPEALCEAPLVGMVKGKPVSARIDRMLITDHYVIIAEFKTGQPPHNSESIPAAYCQQMALYGALLEGIYPAKTINCWLIWTQDLSEREVTASMRRNIILKL